MSGVVIFMIFIMMAAVIYCQNHWYPGIIGVIGGVVGACVSRGGGCTDVSMGHTHAVQLIGPQWRRATAEASGCADAADKERAVWVGAVTFVEDAEEGRLRGCVGGEEEELK